jgi:acetyltransferase-like isoleucine patch superfamily enzyme
MSAGPIAGHSFRQWVKAGRHPAARVIYRVAKAARGFQSPVLPAVHGLCYQLWRLAQNGWANFLRALWWTPLFRSQLTKGSGQDLYLYGGMPLLLGPLSISVGKGCRISGQTTFSGRAAGSARPKLMVGDNVDIGWQTTIAVGRRVEIGDNVRIAGRAFLAGYPGHPLDAEARALGLPDTEDQIGDVILERDVWLATGVTVTAGVRVGRGTIVAAGSVVTKDLPPFVLAGGVPARVLRPLTSKEQTDVA